MRELINIFSEAETPGIKQQVIGAVKATDDAGVLEKVLKVLKAGNIEARIEAILSQDEDANHFLNQIARAIIDIDSPIEEKDKFLAQYSKGIINASTLVDKQQHGFKELCGSDFATKLFVQLSTSLVSQGVGPGEVALAVFSPKISWSGRKVGGGDIQIGNKAVEVKTTVAKGGRWINARKARMQISQIPDMIQAAMESVAAKNSDQVAELVGDQLPEMPARLNPAYWINTIRPIIALNPALLKKLTTGMANALFNQADNQQYAKALMTGDTKDIVGAILAVGYNNYRAYSGFDGMLIIDVPSQTLQYFVDYSDMEGRIKSSTAYIYAPESEAMPQVVLVPSGAGGAKVAAGSTPNNKPATVSKEPAVPKTGKDLGIVNPARKSAATKDISTTPRARR